MPKYYRQAGFTVIELMIVTVILSIVAMYAVPAFEDFIKTNRMRASEGDIVTAIQFARAESVRRGTSIELSPVDGTDNTNEWGSGLRVWLDADDDGNYDAGEELRIVRAFHQTMTLDGTNNVGDITFRPTGLTDLGTNLVIDVCDNRIAERGRKITLLQTGVVSTDTTHICP